MNAALMKGAIEVHGTFFLGCTVYVAILRDAFQEKQS